MIASDMNVFRQNLRRKLFETFGQNAGRDTKSGLSDDGRDTKSGLSDDGRDTKSGLSDDGRDTKSGLSEKGAANIEISVYNYSLEEAHRQKIVKKWENRNFCQIYLDRMRSIYINLKNPEFMEKIMNGEFKEQQVGFMSHHEMCPERWRLLMEQKMKRDQNSQGTTLSASTDMFTCRKCQSKKCVYYELQTRSADEPSTIFVTCLNCGKNWKQ